MPAGVREKTGPFRILIFNWGKAKAIFKQTDGAAPIGDQHPPSTVNQEHIAAYELTAKNVHMVVEHENAAKTSVSAGERVAVRVAAFCGSMTFVWLHVAWFSMWIFLNTSDWLAQQPDLFPFTFLTFLVSRVRHFLRQNCGAADSPI